MEAEDRPINWPAMLETGLLVITAALLLTKVSRGVMIYYIHPRYNWLVIASALVLLGIAGVRMQRIFVERPERLVGRLPMYFLLALPLLFGTFIPAQPLDASALAGRGVDALGVGNSRWANTAASGDTRAWNLLQWVSALSVDQRAPAGEAVLVDGFVVRPPELDDASTFYVARYVVTCCSADGSGVGLPVIWRDNQALADNSWVNIEGTIGVTTINGTERPAIIAQHITPIEQPANPYLYP
ncbi:MAG: TIGR03943 family protein [Roseiflexaceae bacterium]|nr:TIGR03943 family protein [Roseiflexaceae bacterium]